MWVPAKASVPGSDVDRGAVELSYEIIDWKPVEGGRLSEALESTSDVHLLTDGKAIYLEDAPNRIIDLLKSARQPMFLVCVTDQAKRMVGTSGLRKPARSETATAASKARAV